jgi:hypothetical protein
MRNGHMAGCSCIKRERHLKRNNMAPRGESLHWTVLSPSRDGGKPKDIIGSIARRSLLAARGCALAIPLRMYNSS